MIINLSEIEYLQQKTDIALENMPYFIECAVATIYEAITAAMHEDNAQISGTVIDDEWNTFEITAYFSQNVAIMPHLIEIDGTTYEAEFAVRILASYIYSSQLQTLVERLA